MDIEPTQALPLSDYDEETDDEDQGKERLPVAHLKIHCQKGFPETVYPIYEGKSVIGRQEKCTIALPMKALSKEHATIEVQGDSHLVYDMGSRNKSRRGKLYLTADVRYELHSGDRLTFADVLCTYNIVEKQSKSKVTKATSTEVIPDSGSETGSESMLPGDDSMAATTATMSRLENSTTVFEDELEEDAPSSDILQPTQAFDPEGGGPLLKTKTAPTSATLFAEASDDSDEESAPTTAFGKNLIEDTPMEKPAGKKRGSDRGVTFVDDSLVYEDDLQDEMDNSLQSKVAAMATQPAPNFSDAEEDCDMVPATQEFDPDEPTQMYPALDGNKDDDLMATQAYGLEAATQPAAFSPDRSPAPQKATAATVPYTMDAEEAGVAQKPSMAQGTVAYDMDVEEDMLAEKGGPAAVGATVAYTMDVGDPDVGGGGKRRPRVPDATVAYDMDVEATQIAEELRAAQDAVGNKSSDKEDSVTDSQASTQTFPEIEEETVKVSNVGQVATLAGEEMETMLQETNNNRKKIEGDENDAPTQIFHDEAEDDAPTQVFPGSQAPGKDKSVAADTQAFTDSDQETQLVEEQEEPTQTVFDPNEATQAAFDPNEATQAAFDPNEATQTVFDPNEPTQAAFDPNEATQIVSDPSEATQAGFDPDEATQAVLDPNEVTETVFDPNEATQAYTDFDGATQAFDELIAEDTLLVTKTPVAPGLGRKGRPEGTPVVGDADATQLFDADTPTLMVSESPLMVRPQADRHSLAPSSEDEADATVVFDTSLVPTLALEETPEQKNQKQGRAAVANESDDSDTDDEDTSLLGAPGPRPVSPVPTDQGSFALPIAPAKKLKLSPPTFEDSQDIAPTQGYVGGAPIVSDSEGLPDLADEMATQAYDLDEGDTEETQSMEAATESETGLTSPSAADREETQPMSEPIPEDGTPPSDKDTAKSEIVQAMGEAAADVDGAEELAPRKGRGRKGRATEAAPEVVPENSAAPRRGRAKKAEAGDEDAEVLTTASAEKPVVKRGRGRPSRVKPTDVSRDAAQHPDEADTQAFSETDDKSDAAAATVQEDTPSENVETHEEDIPKGKKPGRGRPSKKQEEPAQVDAVSQQGTDGNKNLAAEEPAKKSPELKRGRGRASRAQENVRTEPTSTPENSDEMETQAFEEAPTEPQAPKRSKGRPPRAKADKAGKTQVELVPNNDEAETQAFDGEERVEVPCTGRRGRGRSGAAQETAATSEKGKNTPAVNTAPPIPSRMPPPETTTRRGRGRRTETATQEEPAIKTEPLEASPEDSSKPARGRRSKERSEAPEPPAAPTRGRVRQKAEVVEEKAPSRRKGHQDKRTSEDEQATQAYGEEEERNMEGNADGEATQAYGEDTAADSQDSTSSTTRTGRSRKRVSAEEVEVKTEPQEEVNDKSSRSSRAKKVFKDYETSDSQGSETKRTGRKGGNVKERSPEKEGSEHAHVNRRGQGKTSGTDAGHDDEVVTRRGRKVTSSPTPQEPKASISRGRGRKPSPAKEQVKMEDETTTRGRSRRVTPSPTQEESQPQTNQVKGRKGRKTTPPPVTIKQEPATQGRGRHRKTSVQEGMTQPEGSQEGHGRQAAAAPDIKPAHPTSTRGRGKRKADEDSQTSCKQEEMDQPEGSQRSRRGTTATAPEVKPVLLTTTRGRGRRKADEDSQPSRKSSPSPTGSESSAVSSGRGSRKQASSKTATLEVPSAASSRRRKQSPSPTPSEGESRAKRSKTKVETADEEPPAAAKRAGRGTVGRGKAADKKADADSESSAIEDRSKRGRRQPVKEEVHPGEDAPSSQGSRQRGKAKPLPQVVEPLPSTPPRSKPAQEFVHTPSLRRRTIERQPRVMFTGVVDEKGQKVVKDLGGVLVDSIYECTHLVTDKVRRTVKFLCGMARGLLIVSPIWLERCKDSRMFIDASPFLVKDEASEKSFNFRLSRSVDQAAEGGMLQGYQVHATKSIKPEPQQLKDIVKCAGGQYLTTMPKKFKENVVVISCAEDQAACKPAISAGIPVVSTEFLLTGILRQQVDIQAFQLFVESAEKTATKRGAAAAETSTASKRRRR